MLIILIIIVLAAAKVLIMVIAMVTTLYVGAVIEVFAVILGAEFVILTRIYVLTV